MTVRALLALLDEIDREGGPQAARENRLHSPDRGQPMATAPELTPPTTPIVALHPPTTVDDPEKLPVGKLLAWGDQHDDPEVQDQAARARAALSGLRQRYVTDRELSAITTEEEQLERRLQELRARKGELAPKPKRKSPSYDAAAVRAWARSHNVPCPDRGRIPKDVLDAWRADTAPGHSTAP
ncbi:histone-like nucleoid-structuring protein Lsr2 [Streptomyces sp. NPDC051636]|uniref:Lsr2 family DNA-binding protein n=1 Tax=Streptomyces sp. NPDC051636 TaxID=3365663 RepID=UPI0037A98B52